MLKPDLFSLLLGLGCAHAIPILATLLRAHHLVAINLISILHLGLVARLHLITRLVLILDLRRGRRRHGKRQHE
ncbi:MAG: hypothetical protein B7X82_07485 [Hydrogenophilales bacterium 17-64-65]|nr:MAG: hypothetical protein B7Y27_07590 [Hydrogenophilales bacterium 16-64-40]OZA34054.1 MAG: hypothetical protein B7X82_07485 [Hydrogenophilales bacterium 17-64-65]